MDDEEDPNMIISQSTTQIFDKEINSYTNILNQTNITNNSSKSSYSDYLENYFIDEVSKPHYEFIIKSKDLKILKHIGTGGSSEVYLAEYKGTEVAIKKLNLLAKKPIKILKEFQREISSLLLIKHPNLLLLMGASTDDDKICLITEYCKGGTLFDLLVQQTDYKFPWHVRLNLLLQIAQGINFLHTNKPSIIHRDLKSLNILLSDKIDENNENTTIKISDFGLAKRFKNLKDKMSENCGTCQWMAPEIFESDKYNEKVDVYSYGIILYEMCTRKVPYGLMNQQQIIYYVTFKNGRPNLKFLENGTPSQIVGLMQMCWDRDPNKRPSFEFIIKFIKQLLMQEGFI